MATRLIIDCTTGMVTEREQTQREDADLAAIRASAEQMNQHRAALAEARAVAADRMATVEDRLAAMALLLGAG